MSDITSPIPVLSSLSPGRPPVGASSPPASSSLSWTPIITSITKEVFDTVPTMAKRRRTPWVPPGGK